MKPSSAKSVHQGEAPNLYHFRASRGVEVDLVKVEGETIVLVEAISGETVNNDFFAGLHKLEQILKETGTTEIIEKQLVYGGTADAVRNGVKIVPWDSV